MRDILQSAATCSSDALDGCHRNTFIINNFEISIISFVNQLVVQIDLFTVAKRLC